jgi:hypothetical protein
MRPTGKLGEASSAAHDSQFPWRNTSLNFILSVAMSA